MLKLIGVVMQTLFYNIRLYECCTVSDMVQQKFINVSDGAGSALEIEMQQCCQSAEAQIDKYLSMTTGLFFCLYVSQRLNSPSLLTDGCSLSSASVRINVKRWKADVMVCFVGT